MIKKIAILLSVVAVVITGYAQQKSNNFKATCSSGNAYDLECINCSNAQKLGAFCSADCTDPPLGWWFQCSIGEEPTCTDAKCT